MFAYLFVFTFLFASVLAGPSEDADAMKCGVDKVKIAEAVKKGAELDEESKCALGCFSKALMEKDNAESEKQAVKYLEEHDVPKEAALSLIECVKTAKSEDNCKNGEGLIQCIKKMMSP